MIDRAKARGSDVSHNPAWPGAGRGGTVSSTSLYMHGQKIEDTYSCWAMVYARHACGRDTLF